MCAANLDLSVTSYSDGCKNKVQLCAGQLMNCDVLMLDEPTGHLDVEWLEHQVARGRAWTFSIPRKQKAHDCGREPVQESSLDRALLAE